MNAEHGPANIRNDFELLFKLFMTSGVFLIVVKKKTMIPSDRLILLKNL